MRDEVEEFLRRVAQMRAQAEAQAKAEQQKPGQPPRPQPQRPGQQPPQRMPSPPQRLVPAREEVIYLEPADVEVIDAELAENAGRPLGTPFQGPRQIAEHARHLGEQVDLADDKLEARLHQTFDHQLGRFRNVASETAGAPRVRPMTDVTPTEILGMLTNPESIRDAIVMSEILRRPEERWE